jgi:hypothetical protein
LARTSAREHVAHGPGRRRDEEHDEQCVHQAPFAPTKQTSRKAKAVPATMRVCSATHEEKSALRAPSRFQCARHAPAGSHNGDSDGSEFGRQIGALGQTLSPMAARLKSAPHHCAGPFLGLASSFHGVRIPITVEGPRDRPGTAALPSRAAQALAACYQRSRGQPGRGLRVHHPPAQDLRGHLFIGHRVDRAAGVGEREGGHRDGGLDPRVLHDPVPHHPI